MKTYVYPMLFLLLNISAGTALATGGGLPPLKNTCDIQGGTERFCTLPGACLGSNRGTLPPCTGNEICCVITAPTPGDIAQEVEEADAFIQEQLQPLRDNASLMNTLNESMDQGVPLLNVLTVINGFLTDVEAGKKSRVSLSTIKSLALITRDQIPMARQGLKRTIKIFRQIRLDNILANPTVSPTIETLLETRSGRAFLLSELSSGGLDTEILRLGGLLDSTTEGLEQMPVNGGGLSEVFSEGEFTETLDRSLDQALTALTEALEDVMEADNVPDLIAFNNGGNDRIVSAFDSLLGWVVPHALAAGTKEPSIFDRIAGAFEAVLGGFLAVANLVTELGSTISLPAASCLIDDGIDRFTGRENSTECLIL